VGVIRVGDLARIYVMVGEYDAAIDQLEFLLSRPGELSIPLLRLDPAWDPLRDQPRFNGCFAIRRRAFHALSSFFRFVYAPFGQLPSGGYTGAFA
jgi:hypothetical protein